MLAAFDPWILAFSLVTVAVTIWMGFRSAKTSKSASDFFVAGRSVSVGWNASAISGEYLSAASFMGVAGMVMSSGYDALWYPVCYACGYLFLLLFIAGPLRRFGAYTIPDFAEGRYDSPVFRKIAVIFVLFIGFFYTMPQMKGAGTTLAYIFPGLPYWVGVVLVGAVITLNVALGGMKGITLVQAFQYWAKMFAISVPIFVLMSVYGGYGKQLEVNSAANSAQAAASLTNSTPTIPKGEMPVILEPARGPGQPEYLYLSKSSFRVVSVLSVDRTQFGELFTADKRFADRLFDLKRQVGLANAQSQSLTIPNLDLAGALAQLSYRVEKTVFFHTNLNSILKTNLGTINIFDPTSQRVISALVTVLGQHGLSVIEDPAGALFATPSDLLRSPLVKDAVASDFETIEVNSALVSQLQVLGQVPYAKNIHGLTAWLKELGQAPPRKSWRSLLPPSGTNVTWRASMPLQAYMAASGKHVLWQPSLDDLPAFTMNIAHTAATTDDEFAALMAAGLRANGVALVATPENAVVAVRATELQRAPVAARLPLPAKAPKDETWLNPFGPLTTKAAKAAKPTITLTAPTETAELELTRPLGAKANAQGTFPAVELLKDACTMVAAQGLTAESAAGRKVRVTWSKALEGVQIPPFDSRGLNSKADVGAALLRHLQTNQVQVTQESSGTFLAYRPTDAVIKPVDPKPYALLYTYSLIIALVCGTAGLPHILVRFYTNPDGVAAKRTTMWVMILIGIFYVFPPVFGVMGRNLMPSLYEGTGAKGTDKVVLELPKVLDSRSREIEKTGKQEDGKTGGGSSVLSSSSPVFPSSSPAATGASGGIPWGSILSGITCAGAFAAFMSTFSGLLVSMTGALAHDVYGRMLRPKSTPAERMRMFKFCAVAVGTVAVVLGSFVEPLQINFMVGQAFAIAAASYFPLLFMSVWWRGMTMRGAAAGMLTGGVCALAAVTLTNFSDLKWLPLADFWASHPLLRILCEQPAIWTVPLAIGLMVAVSKLTRAGVPADVRMKMLVLHAPEKLGLKQEYIKEHEAHGH